MNASTFDTLAAARDLEAAGVERQQAEAIVKTIHDGQGTLATKADLDTAVATIRADLYRALWIQGVGIVAIVGGFIAIAASLKLL